MHQTPWSPERPLPPPVSLTSQSHHEKAAPSKCGDLLASVAKCKGRVVCNLVILFILVVQGHVKALAVEVRHACDVLSPYLCREDLLEKEMATHSSTLAWKIPWRKEPGRLRPWGHRESDMTERVHFHFHIHIYV